MAKISSSFLTNAGTIRLRLYRLPHDVGLELLGASRRRYSGPGRPIYEEPLRLSHACTTLVAAFFLDRMGRGPFINDVMALQGSYIMRIWNT